VVPEFDIRPEVETVHSDLLRVIWQDEVDGDGIGDNRCYFSLTGTVWPDVASLIEAEEALIQRVAEQACDAREFEKLLNQAVDDEYPGEDLDEGPLAEFIMLDVGLISAVAALWAAGCISTFSCRGHDTESDSCPHIRFTTDEQRLPFVRQAALAARCGLALDNTGMLELYANDVLALIRFARALFALQTALNSIGTTVAGERPEDNYLDGYDPIVRRRDLADIRDKMEAEQPWRCDGQLSLFDRHSLATDK
jgi:hypothetical protein